jgi:hypothetical protein
MTKLQGPLAPPAAAGELGERPPLPVEVYRHLVDMAVWLRAIGEAYEALSDADEPPDLGHFDAAQARALVAFGRRHRSAALIVQSLADILGNRDEPTELVEVAP